MKFKKGNRIVWKVIEKYYPGELTSEKKSVFRGIVIDVENTGLDYPRYLIEFEDHIDGHDGIGQGKQGHCWWCDEDEIVIDKREMIKEILK